MWVPGLPWSQLACDNPSVIGLDQLDTLAERAVREADRRYTPGLDPAAPNLRVPYLDELAAALSFADDFRTRLCELASALTKSLRRTRATMDSVFERRTVTPTVVSDDLVAFRSASTPEEIRTHTLQVRRRCRLVGEALEVESEAIYQAKRKLEEEDRAERTRLDARQSDLFLVEQELAAVADYLDGLPGTLLADNACLLVLGSWGTGKTHFMCDLAKIALANGTPALLVLANSLEPGRNPLDALANVSGLATNGDALLRDLNALGATMNRRALVLVDAINEGDREAWRKDLASIVRAVRSYRNVGLVLTCRKPFEKTMFTDRTLGLFESVEHFGFEDQEFDAQVEFFSYYSIPIPQVPLITPEFSRPLFLKLLCESLARLTRKSRGRKLREISSGQKGMTYVLEYFVEQLGKGIEQDFGLPSASCWTILKGRPAAGYSGIAGQMASESHDWVLHSDAISEVRAQTSVDESDALRMLDRFVTDGLLSETAVYANGEWVEALVFPYQRFGDHLVARHLLEAHLDTSSESRVRRCFYSNRPLGRIFVLDQWRRGFNEPGLAAAIMLEFPERMKRSGLGRELLDYLPKERQKVLPVKQAFLEGLYWRSVESFTPQTARLINFFLSIDYAGVRYETLEVLVTLAARHNHPFDARALHSYLSGLSAADRDLTWTEYIRTAGESGALHRVLVWFEQRSHARTPGEVVANSIRLLSLGLTTTKRTLRDRMTRALFEMGLSHPAVLFDQTLESLKFNDRYVPERMLAAAYGVAMRLWADPSGNEAREAIVPFARGLVRRMLLPDAPCRTPHTLMRGYALGIVDLCRVVKPTSIATQHVHYLRQPTSGDLFPFRPSSEIADADIADARNAVHMDFENYTIGGLISGRANYSMEHAAFVEVRNQILDRMRDLGYDSAAFESPDEEISRQRWYQPEAGLIDRYGKKYSWLAFFEMYGVLDDQGRLPERYGGSRTPDCDIDPSFPGQPLEWRPSLPDPFNDAPVAPAGWLASGPAPDYSHLLQPDEVDNLQGSWVLLDGYIDQIDDDGRETRSFLKSALASEADLELLTAGLVDDGRALVDARVTEAGDDYYTYMGEIPWSQHFGAEARGVRGEALPQPGEVFIGRDHVSWSRIPVEIPVWNWNWESHHTELTQIGSVTSPAPALCDSLELVSQGDLSALHGLDGRLATLYRRWSNDPDAFFASHVLYLRESLAIKYLEATGQRLLWVTWGSRFQRRSASDSRKDPQEIEVLEHGGNTYGRLDLFDPK